MRLWTLHPQYLDPQGLVAHWREALLAKAVLRGETRGYRRHPQLERFQAAQESTACINAYLAAVLAEADARGYRFDRTKVEPCRGKLVIEATREQLRYEWHHLLAKLERRSPECFARWRELTEPEPHPLFVVVEGPIAAWERVMKSEEVPQRETK